ncbi:MAG: hypothetical protein A2896_03060 [Candidatus Nealsonbacteria bacterium RIFCSPLOWO2_01_FULL_43_32]|uniref:DUF86 domain-containing protein n=1 Tax=Candidatus Nealsonbacteria bacterium RIFCSPLOWO2_01_FULL_43_32 TaxID=1801672 RepID=A0A1G2EFD1_9BACT|nr:MAG: hypothetical protein A2896_03060 [Candidatus Nealsonbacteria bacterium RIFCSPLOWO2_01_FULL_43_32]
MTSLTRQKILEKLENFQEYLKYLYQLRQEARSEKVFLRDFHLFGNTERYLQLSIQSIIDIAHLIIIDLNLKRPEDNYEAISILFEKRIISDSLAQTLTKMVGLRNILVHEYGKIDRKKVFKILTGKLQDLELFKKQIIVFLKK